MSVKHYFPEKETYTSRGMVLFTENGTEPRPTPWETKNPVAGTLAVIDGNVYFPVVTK
jgi:hypothetical protein